MYSFGWGEILGIANRGKFDLSTHSKFSNSKLQALDNNVIITPNVTEISMGVDRLLYAIFENNFSITKKENGTEKIIFNVPYKFAPYKVAITYLNKKYKEKAYELYLSILKNNEYNYPIIFSDAKSIGKVYSKNDLIGTPFVATYDDHCLNNNVILIRDRNTTKQVKVEVDEIMNYVHNHINKN